MIDPREYLEVGQQLSGQPEGVLNHVTSPEYFCAVRCSRAQPWLGLLRLATIYSSENCSNRDNSPLSERIAKVVVITVLSVTERILPVFVTEAKAL